MYPKEHWTAGKTAAINYPEYPVDRYETAIHLGTRENPGNQIATVHLGGERGDKDSREAVEATAQRIVACVNACEGMDPVVLAAWKIQGRSIRKELDDGQNAVIQLQEQRDALFEALRNMTDLHRQKFGAQSKAPELKNAEAVIASVTEDIREERNS
jgi:hypothetical protein